MKLSELQIKQLKLWDNDNYFWKETVAVREFLPFEEAREFARSLKLKSEKEWREYRKSGNKPNNIPSNPNRTYKDLGWTFWSDWLGKKGNCFSFEKARKFIRSLNLKSEKQWLKYCKLNKYNNIPSNPNLAYKDLGWISWMDWFGNKLSFKKNGKKDFLSFEEARKFIQSLNLKQWSAYCKSGNKPDNIPSDPNQTYKNSGWISTSDWLGFDKKDFLPYEEAIKFVHNLNIKNQKEWRTYCKSGNKPDNIPSCPNKVYKNLGWLGWGDWSGYKKECNFLPYEEARNFAHSLKLKNLKEWLAYCKSGNKPDNIPSCPHKVYKNSGWLGWGDWRQ